MFFSLSICNKTCVLTETLSVHNPHLKVVQSWRIGACLVLVPRPLHGLFRSLATVGSAEYCLLVLRKSIIATMGSALYCLLALHESILATMGSAPYWPLALRKFILATMGSAPYRIRKLTRVYFDDQLSPYFHRFDILCIYWDTQSENTGRWQYYLTCPVPLKSSLKYVISSAVQIDKRMGFK